MTPASSPPAGGAVTAPLSALPYPWGTLTPALRRRALTRRPRRRGHAVRGRRQEGRLGAGPAADDPGCRRAHQERARASLSRAAAGSGRPWGSLCGAAGSGADGGARTPGGAGPGPRTSPTPPSRRTPRPCGLGGSGPEGPPAPGWWGVLRTALHLPTKASSQTSSAESSSAGHFPDRPAGQGPRAAACGTATVPGARTPAAEGTGPARAPRRRQSPSPPSLGRSAGIRLSAAPTA